MEFQPTLPQRKARVSASFSVRNKAEEKYWRSFKSSVFIKSYAPIVSLHFSQTAPHRYAVTSGTRIQIYSSKTNRVVKTISKFKEIARSGSIRDDGKLIVASDDSGLVQVFDINSRAVLRSIRAHKQPIHYTNFSPVSTTHTSPTFLTASDDTTLKIYDLSTSTQLSYLAGHGDYVRTASYVPSNPSLVVSGSYDGTVKLWDTRIAGKKPSAADEDDDAPMAVDSADREEKGMAKEVMSFDHGAPVEKVLVHPGGTQIVSAGGPVIRVWDMLSGSCLKAMSNHQKTVTCLEWGDGRPLTGNNKRRLLSAGLDGLIKSYDLEDDYRVGKTMRIPNGGVISLAMSPDEATLLIGSTAGELTVRKRMLSQSEQAAKGQSAGRIGAEHLLLKPGEYESTLEAEAFNEVTKERQAETLDTLPGPEMVQMPNGEIKVKPGNRKKSGKLREWDIMLKSFRYADAVDSAIAKSVDPALSFAVFKELMRRDGLHIALQSRDEMSLLPILKFLYQHIADPRFGSTACDVTAVIIDLYKPVLGSSFPIDNMFARLKQKVQEEIEFQRDLMKIKGQIQMVLAAQSA